MLRWSGAAVLWLALFGAAAHADEVSEEAAGHVMAAEEALKQDDYQRAATEYRIAAELGDSVEIAQQATRIAYSYGINDEALKSAERWMALDKDSDEAVLYAAQLNLRTGEIRQSRRLFEKLLEHGDDPADERLLALVPVLSQEDAHNAFELMRQLARPYRKSAYAHYAVAVLALEAGEIETAQERAQRAIELDDDWIKPKLLYARSLLLSGDEEGAIDYTARLVGDDPDPDPEARLELAIMLVSAGRDDDALSQVNQILLEQPYRTDALRLMAIINFRQDHLDAAKSDFEDLLASGSYRTDAYFYLGRIADRRDERDDAIRYYSQVVSGTNVVPAQTRVAALMAQKGQEEEAIRYLEHFAEINPNFAIDMLRAKAQLLTRLGRYDEALGFFDQLMEYRPDVQQIYLGRAELMLRMGRLDDAIAGYRATVKRWPDSATALNALGYTLADRTEHYDEAAKLIRRALDMQPSSPAIIDSWGWVLFRQGRNEEALGFLEDAYERMHDPEIAGHIVEVLWAMDRDDEAESRLGDAETLFPDSDYLKELRERLQSGGP